MARQSIKPEIISQERESLGIYKTHPSFGTITISKVHTRDTTMFGSEIKHDTLFSISIKKASMNVSCGRSSIFPRGTIVSFYMTPSHFAEMVGAVGNGSGTPLTFDYYPTDYKLEEAPLIDESGDLKEKFKSQTKAQFENSFKKLYVACEELSKLSASKTISKKQFEDKIRSLQIQISNLSDNLSFYINVADEHIEESFNAAKAQLETFAQIQRSEITNAVLSLQSLKSNNEAHLLNEDSKK